MPETRTGAQIMCEALIREGRRSHLRHPRRGHHAVLSRPVGIPRPAAPRPVPARTGGRARRRGLRPRLRQDRRLHRHQRAGGDQPRHRHRRCLDGQHAARRRHGAGLHAPCSARMRFRRSTSPASPCRSPSTIISSRTSTSFRMSSRKPFTWPAPAGPAPCWSTFARTCSRPAPRRTGTSRSICRPIGPRTKCTPIPSRKRLQLLLSAAKPLIMAGNGVIISGGLAELRELAERTGIPVITTLHGIGCFPREHPLCLGMPGMHGWVHVNRALQECDVLFNIGGRFDDRVTGKASTFAPHAKVIHVDIDPERNRQERQGARADRRRRPASAAAAPGRAAREAARRRRPGSSTFATCRSCTSRSSNTSNGPTPTCSCRTRSMPRSTRCCTSAATIAW